MNENVIFCQNCGEKIPANSKFCHKCGAAVVAEKKVYENAPTTGANANAAYKTPQNQKKTATIACAAIAAIFVIATMFLYAKLTDSRATNADLSDKLSRANKEIQLLEDDVGNLEGQNQQLARQLDNLEDKAEAYDDIVSALRRGNIGAASGKYFADVGIVYLTRNGNRQTVTVTYKQYNSTVYFNRISGNSAGGEWAEKWSGNTVKFYITPGSTAGVSTFEFTCTSNNDKFYVIAVVV